MTLANPVGATKTPERLGATQRAVHRMVLSEVINALPAAGGARGSFGRVSARLTRRDFLLASAAAGAASGVQAPLVLPVHRVMDIRTKCTPERFNHFWWRIWPEALRDFNRGGIQLQCTDAKGEIKLSPGDRPIFVGLEPGVINLMLTDHLPMAWDKARSLAGMTTLYEGYHLCVIALSYAHGHQVPFLSTNTCVHEMLHLLLQDVFLKRPKWYQVNEREMRADWYATRLWLFHDGGAIRESAAVYLERLRSVS